MTVNAATQATVLNEDNATLSSASSHSAVTVFDYYVAFSFGKVSAKIVCFNLVSVFAVKYNQNWMHQQQSSLERKKV